MMQTDNSFNSGLNLDTNPIAVNNDTLTSCLNGTLITYNGNEFILQNDMGNGKVEYAYLPSGYAPVGVKEHGGIVYVASKNPITGDCLIGSFPSPELIHEPEAGSNLDEISIDFSDFIIDKSVKTTRVIKRLTDKLRPGDQFAISTDTDLGFYKFPVTFNKYITVGLGVKGENNSISTISKAPTVSTTDLNFNYFSEKTSGELYLIGNLDIPKQFDVTSEMPEKVGSGYKIKFKVFCDKLLSGIEISGMDNVEFTLTSSTAAGPCEGEFTITTENHIVLIEITPKFTFSTNEPYTDVLIPQLTKNITIDIVKETSGKIELNTWKYTYDSFKGIIDLTYGFSGAWDVKNVDLTFYQYFELDSNKSFNEFKIDDKSTYLLGKKHSYNGIFTESIRGLESGCLYLVTIRCNNETEFYKWLWTNELLNNHQNNFNNQSIELYFEIDNEVKIEEKNIQKFETPTDINAAKTEKEMFSYNMDFEDIYEIKLTNVNLQLQHSDTNFKKMYFLTPNYTQDIESSVIDFNITNDSSGNNITTNPSINCNHNNVTIKTYYTFLANPKSSTESKDILIYLLNKYNVDSELTKNLLQISMSMGKDGRKYLTYVCSKKGYDDVKVIIDSTVRYSEYKNQGNVVRSWREICDYLNNQYNGDLPQFGVICSTIDGFTKEDKTGLEYWLGINSFKYVDKYYIPLIKNNTDNSYFIIPYYFDTLEELKVSIKLYFNKFFIATRSDNQTDLLVYTADGNNYSVTTKNSIGGNLEIKTNITLIDDNFNKTDDILLAYLNMRELYYKDENAEYKRCTSDDILNDTVLYEKNDALEYVPASENILPLLLSLHVRFTTKLVNNINTHKIRVDSINRAQLFYNLIWNNFFGSDSAGIKIYYNESTKDYNNEEYALNKLYVEYGDNKLIPLTNKFLKIDRTNSPIITIKDNIYYSSDPSSKIYNKSNKAWCKFPFIGENTYDDFIFDGTSTYPFSFIQGSNIKNVYENNWEYLLNLDIPTTNATSIL